MDRIPITDIREKAELLDVYITFFFFAAEENGLCIRNHRIDRAKYSKVIVRKHLGVLDEFKSPASEELYPKESVLGDILKYVPSNASQF